MDDSQRSKAAAAFGADFMREARSNPSLPANSMVASQANANARPIPTFKVGGPVRNAMPVRAVAPAKNGVGSVSGGTDADRWSDSVSDFKKSIMGVDPDQALAGKKVRVSLDEKRMPVSLDEKRMPVSLDEKRIKVSEPEYKKGGPVRKATGGTMKPAVPMAGRPTGPIDRRAAGGAGKVRKGQAKEPGRGPKLDNAF